MRGKKIKRNKQFRVYLNEEEQKKLSDFYKQSTANSMAEYARAVLLKSPVCIRYRNQSADDFLHEMIQLKNELNAIANNYSQAVQKLHMLDDGHEIKIWAVQNELHKKTFLGKADQIKDKLNQIYELWLQK